MSNTKSLPWLIQPKDEEDEVFFIKSKSPNSNGTIVFIHGFSSSYFLHDVFAKNNDFVDHDYLSINLGGHEFNQSESKSLKEYDVEHYVKQLQKVIEQKHLYNMILIGHSMGGGIALFLANKLGPRVKGMILVDPINPSIYWSKVGIKYLLSTLYNKPKNIRDLEVEKKYIDDKVIEQYLDYEVERFLKNKKKFLFIGSKLINPSLLFKMDKLYKSIDIPTMVIMGSKDRVIPYKETKRYISSLTNRKIKFQTIENAAHIPFIESFEKYNDLVWRFIWYIENKA